MFLYVLDLIGVAVFAVSGALAAGRKRLDLFGVLVLGLVTAIGGGTIRDLLLGRHPMFWLADSTYLAVITGASLLTVAYVRWHPLPHAALLVADAFGLALFAVTGAQIAERAGLPAAAAVLLGAVTGSAGGVVRDVLVTEVPLVLRRGNLYATAAILGASAYFALEWAGAPRAVATFIGMGIVIAVRLASIWWRLHLPEFYLDHPDDAADRAKPGTRSQ